MPVESEMEPAHRKELPYPELSEVPPRNSRSPELQSVTPKFYDMGQTTAGGSLLGKPQQVLKPAVRKLGSEEKGGTANRSSRKLRTTAEDSHEALQGLRECLMMIGAPVARKIRGSGVKGNKADGAKRQKLRSYAIMQMTPACRALNHDTPWFVQGSDLRKEKGSITLDVETVWHHNRWERLPMAWTARFRTPAPRTLSTRLFNNRWYYQVGKARTGSSNGYGLYALLSELPNSAIELKKLKKKTPVKWTSTPDSDTCHWCGERGHWARDCPWKKRNSLPL